MFARNLDQLRIDPDEYFPARPFVEVQSIQDPDHRQVYYGEKDLNFPVGAIIDLPDEKVDGLQWRVTRRWLYIPAVQITVAVDDPKSALYGLQHAFLVGPGPYTAVSKKVARKLTEIAVAAKPDNDMSDWQ